MLAGTQHDRVRKLNRSTAKTARVVDCYARNNLWVNYVRLFYVEITAINEKLSPAAIQFVIAGFIPAMAERRAYTSR